MKAFVFSVALLFLCCIAFSQNVLLLKNNKTGKSRTLKQGAHFQIKTVHDSTYMKAKLVLIKDSIVTLYVQEFEEESPLIDVSIKDIKEIQKASTIHSVFKGIAYFTLPIGAFLFVDGGLTLIRNTEDSPSLDAIQTFGGLGLAAISTLPLIIKPKTYKASEGWAFKMSRKD